MIARPPMFLLDENMPRKVLTSLLAEGYTATRVYDAGLRSHTISQSVLEERGDAYWLRHKHS